MNKGLSNFLLGVIATNVVMFGLLQTTDIFKPEPVVIEKTVDLQGKEVDVRYMREIEYERLNNSYDVYDDFEHMMRLYKTGDNVKYYRTYLYKEEIKITPPKLIGGDDV